MRFANDVISKGPTERNHFRRCVWSFATLDPFFEFNLFNSSRDGFQRLSMGLRSRRSRKKSRLHVRLFSWWYLQYPLRFLTEFLDPSFFQVPQRFYVSSYLMIARKRRSISNVEKSFLFRISGPHASILAYCSEFYGVKERVRIPLIIGFSISFGNTVAAALAWLVIPQTWSIVLWDGIFVYNSWRLYLSLCGVPSLVGLVCLSLFPESPKFLMSQGRTEEALEVFKKIYRVNSGKPANEFPVNDLWSNFQA